MLPDKLQRVAGAQLPAHPFLTASDCCYYLAEYHAHRDWSAHATNQLILNYKRGPNEIAAHPNARALRYYKQTALETIAAALRRSIAPTAVEHHLTFIPVPPSKVRSHPDHCDRLERTLRHAFRDCRAPDIRAALNQTQSTPADHRRGDARISFHDLLALTQLDRALLALPLRTRLVIFDDLLVTGKHFKVAQQRLREAAPEQPIVGLFIARCVRPALHRSVMRAGFTKP